MGDAVALTVLECWEGGFRRAVYGEGAGVGYASPTFQGERGEGSGEPS